MKKFITLTVVLVFFAVGNVFAQSTPVNLTATATVQSALTLVQVAPLAFGNVEQGTSPIIAFDGVAAGVLSITAPEGATVFFNAPADITLDDGSSNTMTVGTLTFGTSTDVAPETNTSAYTINSSYPIVGATTNYLSVGGTLTVDPAQVAGTYSGTLAVSISYNTF